jgi:hypothetical protein
MKSLAALTCAAFLAAAATADADAAGRFSRGSAPSGGGGSVAPHAFHHHSHTTVFVRGGFFGWPGPYYWPGYYYAPSYYYAPPVIAAPAPTPAYWYYCAPLGAYYPYVHDCPGGWQLVAPHPY